MRYGSSLNPEAEGVSYAALTEATTQEGGGQFQPFGARPEEPLLLLSVFEELPIGFHAIPGLDFVVRRAGGYPHPLYPVGPTANVLVSRICSCVSP